MNISVEAKLKDLNVNMTTFSVGTIEAFRTAVANTAMGARAEWIRLAQHRLKSSQADYVNGLQQATSFKAKMVGTTHVYEITLVGKMPNSFEFGMNAFDMKAVRPGWLGGSKAKTSKDGTKYIRIPFRHSTTSTRNFAYSGRARRANLQKNLKRVVSRYGLNRMIRTATGRVIPGPVSRVPSRPRRGVHPYLRGLTRIQTPVGGRTSTGKQRGSSQLMTFRTMSEKSAADSWLHPGLKGAKLLPEVKRWVDNELKNIIQKILKAA